MNEHIDSELSKKLGIACYNKTWDLIDKANKTNADNIEMINQAQASLWFWKHYREHTNTNISIGLWQISRVYSLLNDGIMAQLFANECIEISSDNPVDSFYLAYGYESLARAFSILGDMKQVKINIEKAKELLKSSKETEIDVLLKDLESLEE